MSVESMPHRPRPWLPWEPLLAFRRDPLAFLSALAQQGPVARFHVGPRAIVLLSRPELFRELLVTRQRQFVKSGALRRSKRVLGEGLLTSEGDAHLRQRKLIQPAFHRQRIAGFAETMAEEATAAIAGGRSGETFDLNGAVLRLTLGIVARTLFSTDVSGEAAAIESAIDDLLELFDTVTLPFSDLLQRLPTATNRRAWRSLAYLEALVYRLIAARRAENAERDLLGMLVAAHDPESGGMDDRQVRDEVLTLFLAGHETTANALSWTCFLLAQHPDVAARMAAEVDAVLGGRAPAFEDLPRLAYTEQVFAEGMRLYPPGWAIARQAIEATTLGEAPIPRGSIVIASPYVLHRSPEFFPDPLRFDPERFSPAAKAARPAFTYCPFGGGIRGCIGEPFAWMEGVIVLATIAQRWRLELEPGHPVVPQPLVTLRPKHGMRMRVLPR
ncbi:MAG TPA: cytochrome P450 [Oscillatoriaceae cyanobacterium]